MSYTLRNTWLTSKMVFTAILLHLSLPLAYAEDAPPARVARLNYLDGTVSFSPAGTDDWSVAAPNRPLTIGDRVWADKGARAELHVGSTAMRLGASTSLELLDLGDDDAQYKITQGSFSIRVRDLDQDDNIEIDTPNLAFVIREPGEYRFDVDPDRDTTTVTVRRGAGRAYGSSSDNRSVDVKSNRQLTFSGDDLFYSYSGDAPSRDPFDRWAAERDDRENNSRSVRYVSRDMTGYEELDDNGDWREVRDYGPVWVPRVTVRNWAPYHYGHWSWIAPWGWTWVDDERWGFAPFHYGRWARIDDYWAWVPGPIARRPVYAPALVGFIGGGGNGASWGVSLSIGTPGVAWFALAPGEHYRPGYTSNPAYISNINKTVVVNKTVVRDVYINQRIPNAIAAMPARDFVRGEPAHDRRRDVHEDRLREFSKMPSASTLPVAPIRQSYAGAAPGTQAAPPARFQDHTVIARRQAPEAPAFHDNLARKFADLHGTVPGTGPAFTPTARPGRVNIVTPDRGAPRDASAERGPRPDNVSTAPPAGRPEEARRDTTNDVARPPFQSRHNGSGMPPNAPRPARDASRGENPSAAMDRSRDTPPEAARPSAPESRRDAMRAEPPRAEPPRVESPRAEPPQPARRMDAPDTPRPATEPPRDENRMRWERRQNDRPTEQVSRPERRFDMQQDRQPERAAPQERRNEMREMRQPEERRVEPVRPPRTEPERPRMTDRPAERPAQAAPREERPQRPEGEQREHKRGEQRP